MDDKQRSALGPPLGAFGGLGLVIAMSGPFYRLAIPSSFLDRLDGASSQFGLLGPYLRQGTEFLRNHGPIGVTAWKAFGGVDVALAVLAVIVAGLALLVLTGRGTNVGNAMSLGALLAVGLVVFRMFARPMPSEILSLGWGAYLALASAIAMLAGGLLTARAEAQPPPPDLVMAPFAPPPPTPDPEASPAAPAMAGSVAPPSL
jgi:hypothetical protein